MSRIVLLFIFITLLSCKDVSDKTPPSAGMPHTEKITEAEQTKVLSCDELLSVMVKSSNANAFKFFSDSLVKARIESLSSDKATIKLYVINDVSDDPATQKLTENVVGWLEYNRESGKLFDITNDPDNPLSLKYDTTIIHKDDLYRLCGNGAAIAKPGTGYDKKDVMLAEDIRFNGKLKRFFTIGEFEKVFGKPDSIKLLSEETPCVTIFDTEAPGDSYLYKDGSRFETSNNRVAVDEFWFQNGNFITYKGIRIDAGSTMNDIKQLFPTAVSERLGMDKEGKLWMIQLKEDKEGISDGHIKLFFEDGKVNFIHWWFPC